ncbi:MAG: dihydroorotase [Patescibacteria group bacterium]
MHIERNTIGEAIKLTMTWSDDGHQHVRDGEALHAVLPHIVRRCRRAIIMPNLKPPVTTVQESSAYRERIMLSVPQGSHFTPLMTLYLTDNTSPDEVIRAKESGFVHAVKYYPAGATTNSDSGVTDIKKCYPVLEAMEKTGMVLCVHGEVTDPDVDIFDREKVFIDRVLRDLVRTFPGLKIILEHVTTQEGVDFVMESGPKIGATITAHHLLINRNALFQEGTVGGLRPHNYCLPVAKRELHRLALIRAILSGSPKFFLGTDSAPHEKHAKESACGCAGCFTGDKALELYTEVFERVGALEKLEAFASFHLSDFYGLPRNTDTMTLIKDPWESAKELPFGEDRVVVPFRAGSMISWKIVPN